MPRKSTKEGDDDDDVEYVANDAAAPSSSSNSTAISARRRHSMIEQRGGGGAKGMGKKKGKDKPAAGEVKGLQDSLSKYFEPSDKMRRSRTNSFKVGPGPDQPLQITVDSSHLPTSSSTNRMISSNESRKSSKVETTASSSCSHISPKSPHSVRKDQLKDALTGYFTPNPNNKRRLHKEGEYWQMSRGEMTAREEAGTDELIKHEEQEGEGRESVEIDIPRATTPKQARAGPKSGKRMAAGSAPNKSMAHVPEKKKASGGADSSSALLKRKENAAAFKTANQLVKKASRDSRKKMKNMLISQPVSSSLKVADAPAALKNSIKSGTIRQLKAPLALAPAVKRDATNLLSAEIGEEDRAMFEEARKIVQKDIDAANATLKENANAILPPKIRIHCYEIDTWYSSPYPQEYSCSPLLHICDACLMYLSVPSSHARKCRQQYPPGNEIYRGANFSVFEVDGNQARVYCRNLCLLAKLFIDHKTLYFDVEPFLFYVLTLNDDTGSHFVGYFSKEKFSNQKYNLACIVTLPCYQAQGFGRFLVDLSYALSRREGLVGSPERPLSDLGRVLYQSYWLSTILEFFYTRMRAGSMRLGQITLTEMSTSTGIAAHDLAETLAENRMLCTTKGNTSLVLDEAAVQAHWQRAKQNVRRIWLEEGRLQWTPKLYSPSKEFRMHSPSTTFTPLPSIATPEKMDGEEDREEEEMPTTSARKKSHRRLNLLDTSRKETTTAGRTPKVPTGKIGRKKPPGKSANKDSDGDDGTGEEGTKSAQKGGRRGAGKPRASRCNDGSSEKRHRKRDPSSSDEDDDDEGKRPRHKQSPRLSAQFAQSMSLCGGPTTASSSSKPVGRPQRKTSTISHSKRDKSSSTGESTSSGDDDEEDGVDIGTRRQPRSVHNTSGSSTSSRPEEEGTGPPRRRKILKKRRPLLKRRPSPSGSSSTASSSSSRPSSEAENGSRAVESQSKRRRKSFQLTQSSIEEEEEEEEEERSLCSSLSPQPHGDRLPMMFKPSMASSKEHENLMINMGGEPDTINMGGEPNNDEEEEEAMELEMNNTAPARVATAPSHAFYTVGVSSYKAAPVLIAPMDLAEEEEGTGDEPPAAVQQVGAVHVDAPPVSEPLEPVNSTGTSRMRIPTLHVRQQKPASSPHMDMAAGTTAVEMMMIMPALDAAERHISPGERRGRYDGRGEEDEEQHTEEEDEAPPMLSPQAENVSASAAGMAENEEDAPTPAALVQPAGDLSMAGSSTNDDSFRTNVSQTLMLGEDQHQLLQNNTSSSSIELLHQQQQPEIMAQAQAVQQQEYVVPMQTTADGVQQQSAMPQIRVRSESNVELCSTQPLAMAALNKLQRTSSFSGHQNNDSEEANPSTTALLAQAMQKPTGQQHLFGQSMDMDISSSASAFIAPPYDRPAYANATHAAIMPPAPVLPQQLLPPTAQPLPASKSLDKLPAEKGHSSSSSSKKRSDRSGTGTTTAKADKNVHKGTTSSSTAAAQKQPQQQQQLVPHQLTAASSSSPAAPSAALQAQWAAQMAQYYQHYPYSTGSAAANATAASQQQVQHVQQQAAAAAVYGQQQQQQYNAALVYNQAAWQAWQMANKFPSAYPNFLYDPGWMSHMVNGVASAAGAAGASLATSAAGSNIVVGTPPGGVYNHHTWPRHPGGQQVQHGTANSGGGFYPASHHPPPM